MITANAGYRKAFFAALFLHISLGVLLFTESSTTRPVLTQEINNEPGELLALDKPAPEIVKAVSVDNQEVMDTVNRLKAERAAQIKAEQNWQQELSKQAEKAKMERIKEQQHLAKLKDEAEKMAVARKKQIQEEEKRLKQVAEQKAQEAKRLEELKKEQQALEKKKLQEAQKLAEMKKKQSDQEAKEAKIRAEKAAEAKEAQHKIDAEKAAADASQRAKMAGEVDKYKAMIINAIGRQWILPENVDSHLSSQFRIRLAPDGAVLEVSLMRSSGDPVLDRSAQTAIYKASPLPVPSDPVAFDLFRDISLTVRPENIRG